MAKKAASPEKKKAVKSVAADAGMKKRLKAVKTPDPYDPDDTQRAVGTYVKRRSEEMIDFRKQLKIEPLWKQADEEYVPHELDFGTTRKRFETDQDTGLRSRMVPVGDATQQWREASSAPTLLAKIQTAVAIIADNMPEADLIALEKKYSDTTALAYSLWKRNWQITDAKEKLKLVIFNLIKYGWAPQRTYPRRIAYPKRVLVQKDPEHPENDKYEEREVEYFNDIDREPLNPHTTWIDEMSKPYDPYSTNECYYEVDYSYDKFMVEFGKYANSACVPEDSAMQRKDEEIGNTNRQTVSRSQSVGDQSKVRKDIVTVGFFESRSKDLFALYIPRHSIVLHQSPMPNDDGYLSITHTLWLLWSANLPYGISLWQVIRQNKALYDKMKNMGMDQLVLSIMKFGFFSGTSTALGDGKIDIVPGQARQLTSSSGKPEVNWMEIPGPGEEFWKGIEAVSMMMDNESGISAMLQGDDTPGQQTLGELLHRKEAALKRLKTPVDNIAWLIDQDAYLTLSWMSQIYSIPTIKTFADIAELQAYEKESQTSHTGDVFGQAKDGGSVEGPYEAHFLPQLALHLEDKDGSLTESKESKFFQVGTAPNGAQEGSNYIPASKLKWKGIFKTIPRSIIDSSETLTKATKTEIFNLLVPLLQLPPELAARPAAQILKINEEDPEDWLPQTFLDYLKDGTLPPAPAAPATDRNGDELPPGATPMPENGMVKGGGPTMQAGANMTPPEAPTVVPRGQVTPPTKLGMAPGGQSGVFNRRL